MAPALNPKPPMSVRLPDEDKEWLEQAAADAGMTPHAFLRRLVRDARGAAEQPGGRSRCRTRTPE